MSEEFIPIETKEPVGRVERSIQPESFAEIVERQAAVGNRLRIATESLLVSATYAKDWTIQGGKACLSSAGAERIGRMFQIEYEKPEVRKETFDDALGEGYRYVFTGRATLVHPGLGKTVYAEGRYSTRDKFLGFANDEWRPIEEINEGNIRAAACHTWMGNCIKALFGLRNIPAEEYNRIMKMQGRNAAETSQVSRGRGTQGGTSEDDTKHQQELSELVIGFADAGKIVTIVNDEPLLTSISDADSRRSPEIAKESIFKLSSFKNAEGDWIKGKNDVKQLKGKWLNSTLAKARKLKETLKDEN